MNDFARVGLALALHKGALMKRLLARSWLVALWLAGCGYQDRLQNGGFEINCGDHPCDWEIVEGDVHFYSWHRDDSGLDFSTPGRAVVQQKIGPTDFALELQLKAAIHRDPGATLRFELDWYENDAYRYPYYTGNPTHYWDDHPHELEMRPTTVDETGTFALKKLVSPPAPGTNGLILRIVKEGDDQVVLDELDLSPQENSYGY